MSKFATIRNGRSSKVCIVQLRATYYSATVLFYKKLTKTLSSREYLFANILWKLNTYLYTIT